MKKFVGTLSRRATRAPRTRRGAYSDLALLRMPRRPQLRRMREACPTRASIQTTSRRRTRPKRTRSMKSMNWRQRKRRVNIDFKFFAHHTILIFRGIGKLCLSILKNKYTNLRIFASACTSNSHINVCTDRIRSKRQARGNLAAHRPEGRGHRCSQAVPPAPVQINKRP